MIAIVKSDNLNQEKKGKGSFLWIFSQNSEALEDDKEYKEFLKKMYLGGHSSFLVLEKDEEYILKKYKQN
jgi:hypothetical protein